MQLQYEQIRNAPVIVQGGEVDDRQRTEGGGAPDAAARHHALRVPAVKAGPAVDRQNFNICPSQLTLALCEAVGSIVLMPNTSAFTTSHA